MIGKVVLTHSFTVRSACLWLRRPSHYQRISTKHWHIKPTVPLSSWLRLPSLVPYSELLFFVWLPEVWTPIKKSKTINLHFAVVLDISFNLLDTTINFPSRLWWRFLSPSCQTMTHHVYIIVLLFSTFRNRFCSLSCLRKPPHNA